MRRRWQTSRVLCVWGNCFCLRYLHGSSRCTAMRSAAVGVCQQTYWAPQKKYKLEHRQMETSVFGIPINRSTLSLLRTAHFFCSLLLQPLFRNHEGASCVCEFVPWRDSRRSAELWAPRCRMKEIFLKLPAEQLSSPGPVNEIWFMFNFTIFSFSCTWFLDNEKVLVLSAAAGGLLQYCLIITHLPFSCNCIFKIHLVCVLGALCWYWTICAHV